MPELLLELFSEEIPARMQAKAADDLARLMLEALAPLAPQNPQPFFTARRIALVLTVNDAVAASQIQERGPRLNAPDAALAGFLRKHNASRDDLRQDGDYWLLEKSAPAIHAATLIGNIMPGLLRRFPWPKSMRWGESAFTWVRPLRRILCLLDGTVVPFNLAENGDAAHGLASGAETEGHRFHAPGPFVVHSAAQWRTQLLAHRVVLNATERKRIVQHGIDRLAHEQQLQVVNDPGLLDEVAGLVEWPVPLLGRIDDAFMDLPAEVMQVSMRLNQRYFALRKADGTTAPFFAFAANIEAADGGQAIIAGNERVLRARFADARHFWDLDRKAKLTDRVAALDAVTFHAKLGSQGARVKRIIRLASVIALALESDPGMAARAARLAKADLTTGMVGEFPELQGVMGRYYALHDGEHPDIADAVRDHYLPKGAADSVPKKPTAIAVALADKLDQLAAFFAVDEKPTGSGDPFALRRAALGIIRIIRENGLRIGLRSLLAIAGENLPAPVPVEDVMGFIAERLRVQMRSEGARHDILTAVFAAGGDDDLNRLLKRSEAVTVLLCQEDGADLLAAYRRAANILRIEEKKDGPFDGGVDTAQLVLPEERALAEALQMEDDLGALIEAEQFGDAISAMAALRFPLDAFFDKVTVNAPEPALRRNRLNLLQKLRGFMDRVADFSKIEG